MLTRRDFHKTLTALALTSAAGVARSAASSQTDPSQTVLNRLTFGANETAEREIAELGIKGWIKAQLALPATDPDLQKRLDEARLLIEYEAGQSEAGEPWSDTSEHRPLGFLDMDPAEMLYLLDFDEPLEFSERERPASEVVAASLIRAVHAKAQLREVMTGFWHEHFSVNAFKDELTAVFFPGYDAMLRENAFGNFRKMLGKVARTLTAFWRDLGPVRARTCVVVMSEFGRRLRSNSTGGTDHGFGNAMMVLGGEVSGGRMLGRWPGLSNDALDSRADLAITTDYRHVLAEVMGTHMGAGDLGRIFPGFAPEPVGLFG